MERRAESLQVWGILDPKVSEDVAEARILSNPEPKAKVSWNHVLQIKMTDDARTEEKEWEGMKPIQM